MTVVSGYSSRLVVLFDL